MVGLSMVRELGPIIAAIVFTGKSGAKITAELGSMSVNEQIKATRAMALDPVEFFVTSRFVACVMVLPLLEVISNFVGILGGMAIAVFDLHIPAISYYNQTISSIGTTDLWFGFIKTVIFAVLIALICCYKGLSTRGGATGVGRYTTNAVALCIISIITMNFLLTKILLVLLG
jgi:phospholipid/cholesterol/gamma-HCH transport system permease protein